MRDQIWWYVARSGGIVALVLTALSVIWGLLYSTRILNGRPSSKWTLDLHRYLGGASVLFSAIHVLGLMLDGYIHFGPLDVLVPFASEWRPEAVAWGIVTLYLLVAVQLTSLNMNRIPRKWWHRIHMTSYLLFWTGAIHAVRAGTDTGNPLYTVSIGLSILSVLGLTIYRILFRLKRSPGKAARN